MSTSCPANLYPVNRDLWVGKDTDGNPISFKGIQPYREFLAKLSAAGHICPDVSVSTVPSVLPKETTPFTGFKEFATNDTKQQAKYSAMSPFWVGSDETVSAFENGLNKSLSR